MSVKNKNIIAHGSATMPDDDVTTNIGGAIDKAKKVTFADLVNTGTVEVVSDNAGDTTQSVTVYGRNAAGEKINETINLNGTTPVSGSLSFERLMKVTKSATTTGNVTVMSTTNDHTGTAQAGGADEVTLASGASGTDNAYQFKVIRLTNGTGAGQIREIVEYNGTTKKAYVRDWGTNPDATTQYEIADGVVFDKSPNEISQVRRIFYDAAANPAGGAQKKYYEKIFFYNQHATQALTNATIAEVNEGAYAKIAFDLESSLDGTDSNGAGNNRLTVGNWSGYTFDSDTKDVANSQNFTNQKGQGVILELTLDGGDSAADSFYKLQVQGQST